MDALFAADSFSPALRMDQKRKMDKIAVNMKRRKYSFAVMDIRCRVEAICVVGCAKGRILLTCRGECVSCRAIALTVFPTHALGF